MGIVIYGIKKVPIGIDESLIQCPSCEVYKWADIMIISRYAHFYWIPFFPIDKEANVICKTCGLKRDGMTFNENLVNNYSEIKHKFRHPLFTYIGLAILIFMLLAILFASYI